MSTNFFDIIVSTQESNTTAAPSLFSLFKNKFAQKKLFSTTRRVAKVLVPVDGQKSQFTSNVEELKLGGRCFLLYNNNSGHLFISDQSMHVILRVTMATGKVDLIAGKYSEFSHQDGDCSNALLNTPRTMALDSKGRLFFSESKNHCIRMINFDTCQVSTYCGVPMVESDSVTLPANRTTFGMSYPNGISIDMYDNLFVCNSGTNDLLRVAAVDGEVTVMELPNVNRSSFSWLSYTFIDPEMPHTLFLCDRDTKSIFICQLDPPTHSKVLSVHRIINKSQDGSESSAEGIYVHQGKLYIARFGQLVAIDVSEGSGNSGKEVLVYDLAKEVESHEGVSCITANLVDDVMYCTTVDGIIELR